MNYKQPNPDNVKVCYHLATKNGYGVLLVGKKVLESELKEILSI